ncbi:MAG TPA: WD40 repeat domain-containing protein [Gemmataceae bacterium]|nr:WD40 repeat domain-containing protein [Gemmataceae bacterium]
MLPLRGSGQVYLTCGFSPDGRSLAAGGTGHTVEGWDLTDPGRVSLLVGDTEQASIAFAGYTPNGQLLALHARGSYHLVGPDHRGVLSTGFRYFVSRAALSADGRRFATAGDRLSVWTVQPTALHPDWYVPAPPGQVFAGVAFGPSGTWFAVSVVATIGPSRIEIQQSDGRGSPRLLPVRGERPDKLTWSPDGQFLAGLVDRQLTVWDTQTWVEAFGPPQNPGPGHWLSVLFHPSGKHLLTGGATGEVTLWDVSTWQPLTTFRWGTGPVYALAFAPDGLRAAAAGHTGVVVWDLDV